VFLAQEETILAFQLSFLILLKNWFGRGINRKHLWVVGKKGQIIHQSRKNPKIIKDERRESVMWWPFGVPNLEEKNIFLFTR